jgi:serine protease Do
MNCLHQLITPILTALICAQASAQSTRPATRPSTTQSSSIFGTRPEFTKHAPELKAAFRKLIGPTTQSVVSVRIDDRPAALGTVVAADGWIITKASQIADAKSLRVRLARGSDVRDLIAKIVGISPNTDLAMLKVDARDLVPVTFEENKDVLVGQWVATVGTGRDPISLGVISVGIRKIPYRNAIMGIGLQQVEGGVRVREVTAKSGAEKAGIEVGDVVVAINGMGTAAVEDLTTLVGDLMPGDKVTVDFLRGEEKHQVVVTLAKRPPATGRAARMNRMGGELSERSSGFPAVIQHDTVLSPREVGGPLVNTEGKVIGINIARAGRVESYALPADVVKAQLQDLMSGKLAPTTKSATQPTTEPS